MKRGSPSAPARPSAMLVNSREAARQVDVRQHDARHGGDAGGEVERPVDRRQAVLAGLGLGEVDARDRGEGADGGDQQREDQALVAEGLRAEDQRGDQRDGVRLEEVGGHAGAVADVVTDVVGDRRGVARVVLGDVLLDLADQVGADVGGLGEDAAADPHEHGEQRGAEAEALEHVGRLVLEEQHDEAGAEQAEADGQHADHGAGAQADRHGGLAAGGLGGGGDAQVGAHGEVHAEVADGGGEAGADEEEHRAEDADGGVVGRQHEQREERDRREDGEGAELPGQVGVGALLDGLGDGLHVVGALAGGQHLRPEHRGHPERAERDQGDDDDQDEVATFELGRRTTAGKIPVMRVLLGLEKIRERAGVYADVTQITGRRDPHHTGYRTSNVTKPLRTRPEG